MIILRAAIGLLLCAGLSSALTNMDQHPDITQVSAEYITLEWQSPNSATTSLTYKVEYRKGGDTYLACSSGASECANQKTETLSLSTWTTVAECTGTTFTAKTCTVGGTTVLEACGTMYEFRVYASQDSGSNYGDPSEASYPVFTPLCHGGATGEQCGVRADNTYQCLPSAPMLDYSDLPTFCGQSLDASYDSQEIKTYININFHGITAALFKEPAYMNAVAKAAGEVLEDQTGLYWLNSSTYLGNVYTCASTSTTGCSALGAGVSIQLIVDCGLNTTLKTDLQTYFQQWANTDPATGLTYNTDFAYRLIYYMNQENYEFTYSDAALHSMSMQPLVVSGIASVSKEDLSVGLPAATDMSTATVNPLTSDWMPQTSDGHPGWKTFEYPCGINLKGIVECVGYYDQYAIDSTKATRHVAPVYRSRRFKQISTDKLRTCGITHNDRLLCWGYTDFGTYTTDDSMVFPCGWTQMIKPKRWEYRTNKNGVRVRMRWRWKWVSVGGGGIDGTTSPSTSTDFKCFENVGGMDISDVGITMPYYTSAGCTSLADGVFAGGLNVYEGYGECRIASGGSYTRNNVAICNPTATYSGSVCGVRLDGKIRCYGCNEAMKKNGNLQSSQPSDIESWKKVEVSKDGKWAIGWAENGEARTWGEKLRPVIPKGVYFRDIPSLVSVTDGVLCGLQASDSRLLCFGHYLDNTGYRQRVYTTFSAAGGAFETAAETAYGKTTGGMKHFSKWGCGTYWDSSNSRYTAQCLNQWEGSTTSRWAQPYASVLAPGTIDSNSQFKFITAPGTPYDLQAVVLSPNSARIFFYPPTVDSDIKQQAIMGYQVMVSGGKRRRRRRGGEWRMKGNVINAAACTGASCPQTFVDISRLRPKETYIFRLRAFSSEGGYYFSDMSAKSDVIETTVGVPNSVASFWTDSAESGDDFIILYWLSPPASGLAYDVTHYRVSHREYSSALFSSNDVYAAPKYAEEEVQDWANGLEPATTYTFKVAACNAYGCGDESPEISATTNFTEVSTGYQVKSNMTIVAQWCVTYNLDCGLFISTDTWTEDMGDCFIETVVQWLMWHSTQTIEDTLKNEAIEQAVTTPAPTPNWGGNYTLPDNVTVIDTTDEDWEDLDDYCEEDPAGIECIEPTFAPTLPPVVQCSSDGYYDDPGALNGSANGTKHLNESNVTITGTTDLTVVIQYTNGTSAAENCWDYSCNRDQMVLVTYGKSTYCEVNAIGVTTVSAAWTDLQLSCSTMTAECADLVCSGSVDCQLTFHGSTCAYSAAPTMHPSTVTPAPTTPFPTIAPTFDPSAGPTAVATDKPTKQPTKTPTTVVNTPAPTFSPTGKPSMSPSFGPTYATVTPTTVAPTTPAPSQASSTTAPTSAGYSSDTATGTNVDFEVTTGTEEQADTVLAVITANDDTTDNEDSMSFSTEFTTVANNTYSAYTGSQTYDSVAGAYEAPTTSEDTTGLYVALLASLIVIACLLAFILFGWYKRHKLKEYFERRERVKSRFTKATSTISQMRRLGKLTAVLKAKDQAFSYENLEEHHKNAANDLLSAIEQAGGNAAADAAALEAENARIKKTAQIFQSQGNAQYKNGDAKVKAEMVLTKIESEQDTTKSDADAVDRTLDDLKKSLEYQQASFADQRKMEEDKLRQRREALKARRALAAAAAVSGGKIQMPTAAVADDSKDSMFDEEAELERVIKETQKSQEYLTASGDEQRALMKAKLNERKAMLRARRAGNAMHDDLVKERVEGIVKSAAEGMNFTIAELTHDDEDELARLRAETEASIIHQDKTYYEQQEEMRRILDERRAKMLDARKQESGANQLDHEIVDTIMERASSALLQELAAEAYDEEAELARLKHDYEHSREYLELSAEQRRVEMLEKLDSRKAAIRARQAEKRAIDQAQEEERGHADNKNKDTVPSQLDIRANEIAVILAKVEENVIDACNATAEASNVLEEFKLAQQGQAKGSMEAQLAQKAILQERLRERREKKLADAKEKAEQAGDDAGAIEAPALSEKWREVEDDLVEQALESFETECGDYESQMKQAPNDSVQMAVLAKVMWQLDRDMAHADELRSKEWASTEAASILKHYDQAAKREQSNLADQKKQQKKLLDDRIAKRKAERTRKKAKKMWSTAVTGFKATMGMARNPTAVDSGMRALNETEPLTLNI